MTSDCEVSNLDCILVVGAVGKLLAAILLCTCMITWYYVVNSVLVGNIALQ